jgi:glycosyltransferase involved in cell wall biosynthesis
VPVELAIIVPVYNEEGNIQPLAREILDALSPVNITFEVLFVDDASTDGTWRAIGKVREGDGRVRGVRHQRNSGQSAAFLTGLRHTSSEAVGTLDGDRQNDPADLPRLLAALNGADFVCGVRVQRKDTWVRRVSSGIARAARRAAFRVDYRDTGCFLRVFRRTALADVLPFNGWHRFLPVLVHHAGVRVLELEVHHRPRISGASKYGIWNRLGRGLFDLVGVSWYLRRRLAPSVTTDSASPAP